MAWKGVIIAGLILGSAQSGWAAAVYYQYKDHTGKTVMTRSLPPAAAKYGYGIYDAKTHSLIREVAPALSDEQLQQAVKQRQQQARLAEWDKSLRRKYSHIDEIAGAKQRRLNQIETNISMLKGNLHNTRESLRDQQKLAADEERQGRKVSEAILTKISNLKALAKDTELKIQLREQQQVKIAAEFDADMERFAEISGERTAAKR